jgi:hypothetical protein
MEELPEYTKEQIEIMQAEHQLEMERWWWMNQES